LARADLAAGDLVQAQAHVDEILAYVEGGGRMQPDDCNPFWTYLTCYQVLTGAGDRRAVEVLDRCHAQLMDWVAHIPDEALRRSFLENVPENREIARLWEAAHPL